MARLLQPVPTPRRFAAPPEAAGQLRQVTAGILGTAQSLEQLSDQIRILGQTVRVVGDGDVDLTVDPEPIPVLSKQLRKNPASAFMREVASRDYSR